MKDVLGFKGVAYDTTMTVAELKAKIADLPDDMLVLGYWDMHHWAVLETRIEPYAKNGPCFILNVSS